MTNFVMTTDILQTYVPYKLSKFNMYDITTFDTKFCPESCRLASQNLINFLVA